MKFSYLGSGSKGNAALVEAGSTLVMVDCGFSVTQVESRLDRLSRSARDIDAIVVTHEHSDHLGGVARLARRYELPVWMTAGTWAAARDKKIPSLHLFNSHQTFSVGDLTLRPMPVPHDAREPCQFVFDDGQRRLAILTDTGHITPHIVERLEQCDALVIEFNHDYEMLMLGPYPQKVKQRVAGNLGHLNNRQAAEMVGRLDLSKLQHLVAVHISEVNNSVTHAMKALSDELGEDAQRVEFAGQKTGLGWRELA
ncbi:MAG: MBL fold metallo-hydrolase [Gammaproteobacteria bacterium]